ncbi:O-antigen/teichoic acid export membrane protein [Micromonospora luteifusca]|uniref:O-antigen/teichoic acid export membrane protein n=1 Tax=Micromonospora luteifusca TaxID=709860 RepID=A0ABS2LZP8_9ACTN|nr:lipopolysaccharide biosynthesis protein [Micromonospora luteifusca]MBM7493636.1 O-antigen/teichoic acid export membrane protein [Micromonospora luteifusca]
MARRSRGRALVTGIASSLAGKAVGLAAPLLITPVAFRYLGAERYGMWMAISSLTAMALFADFGLGNGLLTRLSRLYATGEGRAAAREIASAYALLGTLSVALLLVLLVTVRLVPWPTLLNVEDPAVARDARAVVLLCFGAFLVNIPLALIQRVQYAHQQVAQSNLWQAVGSIASAGLVVTAVAAHASPPLVIAAAVLAVPLVNLANSICYFGWQDPSLRPRVRDVRAPVARGLLRLGARFFALSLLSSVALNIDGFLVGRVLGLHAAANYAVILRMFAVLALFVTLVNLPLWPANGEALARGDVAWVRRSTRRMACLSAAAVTLPALCLVLTGNDILRIWVRSDDLERMPASLFGALAAWSFLVAVAAPLFMVQNSVGLLRPQFVGWGACLAVAVPLKIFLATRVGLSGVAIAAAMSYGITVLPAAVVGYRRALAAVPTNESSPFRMERDDKYTPRHLRRPA